MYNDYDFLATESYKTFYYICMNNIWQQDNVCNMYFLLYLDLVKNINLYIFKSFRQYIWSQKVFYTLVSSWFVIVLVVNIYVFFNKYLKHSQQFEKNKCQNNLTIKHEQYWFIYMYMYITYKYESLIVSDITRKRILYNKMKNNITICFEFMQWNESKLTSRYLQYVESMPHFTFSIPYRQFIRTNGTLHSHVIYHMGVLSRTFPFLQTRSQKQLIGFFLS